MLKYLKRIIYLIYQVFQNSCLKLILEDSEAQCASFALQRLSCNHFQEAGTSYSWTEVKRKLLITTNSSSPASHNDIKAIMARKFLEMPKKLPSMRDMTQTGPAAALGWWTSNMLLAGTQCQAPALLTDLSRKCICPQKTALAWVPGTMLHHTGKGACNTHNAHS